jgi:hypothetical protein
MMCINTCSLIERVCVEYPSYSLNIDDPVEIEDDLILDVVDIMSQSYLNIDEEDIIQDVVDLIIRKN